MRASSRAIPRSRLYSCWRRGFLANLGAAALLASASAAQAVDSSASGADSGHADMSVTTDMSLGSDHGGPGMPGAHIPAGVTGAYMVPAGEGMANFTPSFMHMSGNYIGSSQVSPAQIASSVFSGQWMKMTMSMGGMMPPKTMIKPVMLRIIPSSMDMQMYMLNTMYGLTDKLNLMFMASYAEKSMTMTTFAGMSGVAVLGQSSGTTYGFNDAMIGGAYRIYQDTINHLQFNLMLALPIGTQDRTVQMLSPMGAYMTMRAPYAMQIGTGTVDLVPTVAYSGIFGAWSWGALYRGRFPLDYNSEGYQFGAANELTAWGGYSFFKGVTATARIAASTQDHVHGADALITGLSPPANPLYYGGKHLDMFGGLEIAGHPWGFGHTVLGVEAGGPLYQEVNGPQLGRGWQLSLTGRVMF
ncbi:hypothetical protein [Methylocystis bryophila]|uniref:Alpha-amylase n=1 Tax=Methylocystis bryophila TaxID=655015 RepID=A0A1W6MV47_9HYPH|nr:hypothetical protein [Methylocystis bryophila]ARN81464.1 hypothetical protein B1812_10715 [Methylocystis bryophila]